MKVHEEIERLRGEIRRHDRKYYVDAAPEISDLAYDELMQQLKALEQSHPELVTADSPTQRIGDQPVEGLQQVEHSVPMLSIDNTYSEDEVREYAARTQQLLDGESIEWVVETQDRRCRHFAGLRSGCAGPWGGPAAMDAWGTT